MWSALFALQVAGEDLFAHIDRERVAEYARCLERAVDTIGTVAFFFDRDDFTDVNSLLQGALAFRSGKESVRSMKDSQVTGDIANVIRDNLHEFERFCWESLPRCWTCGWPWTDIEPASTSESDRS